MLVQCAAALSPGGRPSGTGSSSSASFLRWEAHSWRCLRTRQHIHALATRRYPVHVAAYARVSTPRQAQDQTITQQVARLQAKVQAEGWTLATHQIYCDDGYSGARLDRPALDRLRDAAARGEFQALLLTTPDRLARRFVHQALLLEEFAQLGCPVVFLDQSLSQDPQAQLLVQMRGAVAEYERALIAERTRRGRLAKLQAGRLLPWIHTPDGYRSDPEPPRDPTRLRIEEPEARVVRQMCTWYAEEGLSIYGIAARLMQLRIPAPHGGQRWHPATVGGILRNEDYACPSGKPA